MSIGPAAAVGSNIGGGGGGRGTPGIFALGNCVPLQVGFKTHGEAGVEISDWWPHLATCVDDVAFVRSMYTTDNDHAAEFQMHHGRHKLDEPQPVVGSWIHYGLGTLNENLPQFVVLGEQVGPCCGGSACSGAAYLGPQHAGVELTIDPSNPLPVAKPSAGETAQPAVTPPAAKPQVVQPASAAAGTREDVPSNTVKTPPQRDLHKAPANPAPRGNATAHKAPDRVIRLANADNPVAQTILGLRYLDGTVDTAVNLPEALKYLTAAAIQGQPVAQYRLGTLYERGQGVPADGAKAAHWYQMAANQGNRKAMHNLAVAYASGATGKKNMAEAARWFAKAAALGLSDSQFNLAVLYERGDGVPQSLLDAYKWYSIAAASGDAESKARVGVLQSQLSDSDRAAAQKAATAFHAAPLNRSANVPPEPADLG